MDDVLDFDGCALPGSSGGADSDSSNDCVTIRLCSESTSELKPRTWPRIRAKYMRHWRLSTEQLIEALGADRSKNELRESMIARLDARNRNQIRRATRYFGPKSWLMRLVNTFVAIMRKHDAWVDEHFTHFRHRKAQNPERQDGHHVLELLDRQERVSRLNFNQPCNNHEAFLDSMRRRIQCFNKHSFTFLSEIKRVYDKADTPEHANAELQADLMEAFGARRVDPDQP